MEVGLARMEVPASGSRPALGHRVGADDSDSHLSFWVLKSEFGGGRIAASEAGRAPAVGARLANVAEEPA